MKISSISDIHIYDDMDERAELLTKFLNSSEVTESDVVVLLGDIFDMMVGNKSQYLDKYKEILSEIKKICKNKKLIYISGNHDFSLDKILKKYFSSLDFQYSQDPIFLVNNGVKIYLSHGDEVDNQDVAYKRWKAIYSNIYFQKAVDLFLPFEFISILGRDASSKSKKRSNKKFDYDRAQEEYSLMLSSFKERVSADKYILGHTHIKYCDEDIANNGFPLKHNCFVYYNGSELKLIDLG